LRRTWLPGGGRRIGVPDDALLQVQARPVPSRGGRLRDASSEMARALALTGQQLIHVLSLSWFAESSTTNAFARH